MNLLNGNEVSKNILDNLKPRIEKLKERDIIPQLCIILVGENRDSILYVNQKQKYCNKRDILCTTHKLDENVGENEIIELLNQLNDDGKVHGIIIEMPLPKHLNKNNILKNINSKKDIDGYNPINTGKLLLNYDKYLSPCTPKACLEILKYYKIELIRKNIVIVGSGNIGIPLSILLLQQNATVTICHIYTKNIKEFTKKADIIISCCGSPKLIKKEWINNNSIILDCGINYMDDKLVGDVDYDNVKDKCLYITPVPGGVGPVTISVLISQLIDICEDL
jgi:methylenetetrahydrofolate dehydrogenase (NADP+)/methenyltetrahydrofolate cyclohydrolase